jgi:hypothetical protein
MSQPLYFSRALGAARLVCQKKNILSRRAFSAAEIVNDHFKGARSWGTAIARLVL